jgi:chaperonin cofactor prefoldin
VFRATASLPQQKKQKTKKVSALENQCSALRRELSVVEAELNTTINEDAALVSTLGTFIVGGVSE